MAKTKDGVLYLGKREIKQLESVVDFCDQHDKETKKVADGCDLIEWIIKSLNA